MSWIILPQELQLHIVDHFDRETCKSARLVSRSTNTLVTPKLFHTIHLTPNTRSFDRARGITKSPQLSQHVRSVVYHLGVLMDVHNGYPAFRDDIMRIHKPTGSIDAITADILWKYHCFDEELTGQSDFAQREQREELHSVCQNLPALTSVTTILDEDDPFSPPQDFIGRRTGMMAACSADGAHFSDLLTAVAGKTLTSIHGWSMSWSCLSRVADGVLGTVNLQLMNELALGLFNSEFQTMKLEERQRALAALDTFLKTSVNTENYILQLDFDEIPFEDEDDCLQEISTVVFKHHWPSLQKLELGGIAATQNDIVCFLQKHQSSLKSLHLDDIAVIDELSYDAEGNEVRIPGSVIGLFRQINESLLLDTVSLSGTFTNRKDESWFVNLEHEDPSSLRRNIEMWLSRRTPPPFPPELLYKQQTIDQQRDEIDIGARGSWRQSSRPTALPQDYSDESWLWDAEPGPDIDGWGSAGLALKV